MNIKSHRSSEGIEEDPDFNLGYQDLSDLQSLQEYAEGKVMTPGQYSGETEVGFIGSKAFYVHDHDAPGTSVSGYLMADVLMDELDIEGPQIHYDEENEKILVEEVPGVPSNQYRITETQKMARHIIGKELEGNREQLNEAVGLKYFLGDSDIPPNIVVTENSAYPIDFDKAGEQSEKSFEQTRNYAQEVYEHFNWDFSELEFRNDLKEMVEEIDLEKLKSELRGAIETAPETSHKKDYLIRNSLENVRKVR